MTIFSNEVLKKISESQSVVLLTGAGVSVESGIPAFRDKDNSGDNLSNFTPEYILNIETFRKDPELVWKYYRERRKKINESKISDAHIAINDIEKLLIKNGKNFYVITQNSDGLHNKAKNQDQNNDNIYQIHGDIFKNRCININCNYILDSTEKDNSELPICPTCKEVLKSDMSSFGEDLPKDQIKKAIEVSQSADIFIMIGTGATVNPAARLPKYAKDNGAFLIEINLKPSRSSSLMDVIKIGKSSEILRSLFNQLKEYNT